MRLYFFLAIPVVAALIAAVPGSAAERPSFAGNWVLDTSQSTGAVPEWSGMQIGQDSRWVRMGKTDKNGRQVQTLEGECRTDGRFHPVEGGQGGSISCKWDGSTLVTEEHWDNAQNARTIRTMLQPDGTLVQEIAATGTGAGGNAHLVWRKQ
jgi:hypothetical protein